MVEPLVLTPKLFWSIAAVPIAALAAERMATLQKNQSMNSKYTLINKVYLILVFKSQIVVYWNFIEDFSTFSLRTAMII